MQPESSSLNRRREQYRHITSALEHLNCGLNFVQESSELTSGSSVSSVVHVFRRYRIATSLESGNFRKIKLLHLHRRHNHVERFFSTGSHRSPHRLDVRQHRNQTLIETEIRSEERRVGKE